MERLLTRRNLLACGGKALVAAGAGAAAHGTLLPPLAQALDWKALLGKAMPGGYGRVSVLEGEAYQGDRPLQVGDKVDSGHQINVTPKSRVVMNMSDQSVFQFTGPTSLELILSMMREGIFNLLLGSILAVVPSRAQYLVGGPTGTIGIKGTIFYREVFPTGGMMTRTMEGTMQAPEGAMDYHCTCNGEVEYHRGLPDDPFLVDKSEYHHAYFIDPSRSNRLIKAPMANHFDDEIKSLVALQEGEKHDTTWIDRYKAQQQQRR